LWRRLCCEQKKKGFKIFGRSTRNLQKAKASERYMVMEYICWMITRPANNATTAKEMKRTWKFGIKSKRFG
jgi:hypothetical protein